MIPNTTLNHSILRTHSLQQKESAVQLLAAIVESSDDAIISNDLLGVVTSWNKSAERLFGYKAEEIIGRSIELIIPAELQSEELRILEQIKTGKKIDHFQTVRCNKSGKCLEVSLTESPIIDAHGEIVGAAKIIRDVTQQGNDQIASRKLAAIVESSDDAIVSKDLNGIVISWNRGAERMFGYTANEIVGKPITLIIPPELQSDEVRILSKIRAGEKIDHFQTVRCNKNGSRLQVSLTVSPVKDSSGNIIGAAKIARDVTQQKKLEQALHTSEKLASVGRLAATIAHEINNPLEAVTNFIYLAKRDPALPEHIRRHMTYADQELRRVAHIAQQTLGFYRDTSRPAVLVVPDVVEDVLAIYERKVQHRGVHIERQIQTGLTVYTLQGELKQILSNLVANAIDASREGGKIIVRARAALDRHTGNHGIRITIADNGTGIAPEDREGLFHPFFTTKKDVGTGLGLWITKDLLEKKGGHIHFRSRNTAPSGTVMSIYLPLQSAIPATEHVA